MKANLSKITAVGAAAFLSLSAYSQKPNIIVIYTDDMGIGDVSFTNGKVIPTPNIDRYAEKGKIFTKYYTNAPVSSPSRACLTTGMYPIRWGINTFLNDKKFNAECEQLNFLDSKAPSMARNLKSAGYKTAHFGKWHMGGGRDVKNAPSIKEYGFDEYASTYESPDPDPLITATNWIWSPQDSIKRWDRTAYFIDKTLDFLERNSDQPCFVNLWPDDIHSPWVPNETVELHNRDTWETLPTLRPVIEEYDRQIGRFLDALHQKGLDKNTLVIFTSDNGPAPSFKQLRTNNIRGVKNSLYEGGINMPFFVYWPGVIDAGQIDSVSVFAAMDLLPSLCKIAGVKVQQSKKINGEDVSDIFLTKHSYKRKKDIYWEYGRNKRYNFPNAMNTSLQLAVRHGKWKCFTNVDGSKVELYDLESDPKESNNIAADIPKIANKLKLKMLEWYSVNDKSEVKF